MTKGSLKIHNENILPIIKKSLYSDKDIFVRELVSNACDAISKCKVLREHKELEVSDEELRIDITINTKDRTLTFADTGIGMTAEEVEKYIAQIAFSGAEDFLNQYQKKGEEEAIIGHFGLGFYSAYMAASKVAVNTLSYKTGSLPVLWSCDGSSEYDMEEGSRATRGTEITLFIDKDSDEFLEEAKLQSILRCYCAFLPVPIYLNGTRINEKEPLWLKKPSECTEQEYLDFYHSLYPFEQDPIFWIHLSVDYPFHLKGILYFPKITKRFDWNKSAIKLFCNRVFISDNCKDLIPDYLTVLRGAIESPDIPLNVSRSYLQMDRTVRQLSSHVAKKVTDRLDTLFTTDKEAFIKAWPDIETIIKLGCLQDEKFYEKAKSFLLFENLEGTWTTTEEYVEKHPKTPVFYTNEESLDSHALTLYRHKGIEVLKATSMIDSPLMNLLESKIEDLKFQRIDDSLDDALLDPSREKTLLEEDGKTQSAKISETIKTHLALTGLEVEAKSLASDEIPAVLLTDEKMRRMQETFALTQGAPFGDFQPKKTFVVNTNHPLIQKLYGLQENNPTLAKELSHYLYELSLLSQKQLKATELSAFISRSHRVLSALV